MKKPDHRKPKNGRVVTIRQAALDVLHADGGWLRSTTIAARVHCPSDALVRCLGPSVNSDEVERRGVRGTMEFRIAREREATPALEDFRTPWAVLDYWKAHHAA